MRQACHGKHGTEACRAEVQKLGEGRTRTQSSRCDGDSVSESARDCHKSGGGGPCCCAAWEASPCASDDISESIAVVCAAQHARISSVMALCSMLFMDKRTHLFGILSQGVGAREAECLLEVPRLQRSPGHQDRALRVLFRKGGQLPDDHSYKKSTRGAFWQRRRHCGARMQRYVSAAGRTDQPKRNPATDRETPADGRGHARVAHLDNELELQSRQCHAVSSTSAENQHIWCRKSSPEPWIQQQIPSITATAQTVHSSRRS